VTKSLNEQLEDFAEETPLPNALVKLGILGSDEKFISARIIRDWTRGGAETYNMIFEIVSSQRTASYILKACVPFSPAIPIDRVLGEWIDRRTLLQQHGVKAPKLYGARLGMILEDFIPHELGELNKSKWNSRLIDQVFDFAKTLTELRFAAVGPFADLRTDEVFVFQVDFGTDLGEPYVKTPLPDYLSLAQKWLQSLGVNLEA
jgi:hypothetical protein